MKNQMGEKFTAEQALKTMGMLTEMLAQAHVHLFLLIQAAGSPPVNPKVLSDATKLLKAQQAKVFEEWGSDIGFSNPQNN